MCGSKCLALNGPPDEHASRIITPRFRRGFRLIGKDRMASAVRPVNRAQCMAQSFHTHFRGWHGSQTDLAGKSRPKELDDGKQSKGKRECLRGSRDIEKGRTNITKVISSSSLEAYKGSSCILIWHGVGCAIKFILSPLWYKNGTLPASSDRTEYLGVGCRWGEGSKRRNTSPDAGNLGRKGKLQVFDVFAFYTPTRPGEVS